MTDKNDLTFIEHILDSINAIEKFSKNIEKVSNKSPSSEVIFLIQNFL